MYICIQIKGVVGTLPQASIPKWMSVFLKNLNRGEVLKQGANSSFTHYYSLYEKKNLLPVCSHLH